MNDLRAMTEDDLRVVAALAHGIGTIEGTLGRALAEIAEMVRMQDRDVLRSDEQAFLELTNRISRQLRRFDRQWLPRIPS